MKGRCLCGAVRFSLAGTGRGDPSRSMQVRGLRGIGRRRASCQALDRTQPGLPLKPGRCGTMTHDYKRNGTMTLFAALDVLEGKVIGCCMQRHRHQEFIRFLTTIEAAIPAGAHVRPAHERNAPDRHQRTPGGKRRSCGVPVKRNGSGLAIAPLEISHLFPATVRTVAIHWESGMGQQR